MRVRLSVVSDRLSSSFTYVTVETKSYKFGGNSVNRRLTSHTIYMPIEVTNI